MQRRYLASAEKDEAKVAEMGFELGPSKTRDDFRYTHNPILFTLDGINPAQSALQHQKEKILGFQDLSIASSGAGIIIFQKFKKNVQYPGCLSHP